MLWRTPTAVHILLRPGVHFKPIKGNALLTDGDLRQDSADLPVKSVLVHAQVGRGIAETDQAGLDLHHLSTQIHGGNLFALVAQLLADGEAGPLVGLPLYPGQSLFTRATRMRRWPAGEFPVALLGIGVAQAVHFR